MNNERQYDYPTQTDMKHREEACGSVDCWRDHGYLNTSLDWTGDLKEGKHIIYSEATVKGLYVRISVLEEALRPVAERGEISAAIIHAARKALEAEYEN